ncbi:hypothetical protein S1OALGB6SA_1549, partial [Olavius algarvensis spirochete endosymbiont]|uniref:RHS repeat-associated core domain-containing protein n=1 Tax=Olavius algarvensis spirochete endosymbiont TaxID=260710 RepID=UPI000F2049D4
ELDEETGLYYYGARYYEPATSRWISPDPAGFELINPMESDGEGGWKAKGNYSVIEGTNWYSYTSNNPVLYVDPTGKSGQKENMGTPYFRDGRPYTFYDGLGVLSNTNYGPENRGGPRLESTYDNLIGDLSKGRAIYTQKVGPLEAIGRALPTGMGDSSADAATEFIANILDPDTSTFAEVRAKYEGYGENRKLTGWGLKVSLPTISDENRSDGSNSHSFELYTVTDKAKALKIMEQNPELIEGILRESGMIKYKNNDGNEE